MTSSVADIIEIMEEIAPPELAESWDNSGLQVGHAGWPVKKIMIALDPVREVIAHAAERKADMLITHHPLLFRPIKALDLASTTGEILAMAIRNALCVYAAHTNFDCAVGGLNDELARRTSLQDVTVLAPQAADEKKIGLGRIGQLPAATRLETFCRSPKLSLDIDRVRMIGDPDRLVRRVALCSGSGASLMATYLSSDADVFITGDVRYHDAREVLDRGRALVDIGHFGSEHIMVKQLGEKLLTLLEPRHPEVEVLMCDLEEDPFVTL